MSADRHARTVVTAAATSSMVAAATAPFAWCFARFTDTGGYRYCVPLVVYGTVWVLVLVFAAGVAWSAAERVGRWAARGTARRVPAPGVGLRRRPDGRWTDITLVDMSPVDDVTQEMPRAGHAARLADVLRIQEDARRARETHRVPHHLHVPPGQADKSSWRPPVSDAAAREEEGL